MKTIAIIGQKGGTGKSTIAIALAVTAAHAGESVVIIDTDPQTSSMNWKDRRPDMDNPMVVSVQATRVRQTVEAARANGADFVLIDTAGKNETAAIEAAKVADLVLIPSHPQIFDMDTLPAARHLVRIAGDPPAFVVYNGVHHMGYALADQLKKLTKSRYDLEPCPVHLTTRAIYAEAQAAGKAPQEVDPRNPAVAELQNLYLFVSNYVNSSTSVLVTK